MTTTDTQYIPLHRACITAGVGGQVRRHAGDGVDNDVFTVDTDEQGEYILISSRDGQRWNMEGFSSPNWSVLHSVNSSQEPETLEQVIARDPELQQLREKLYSVKPEEFSQPKATEQLADWELELLEQVNEPASDERRVRVPRPGSDPIHLAMQGRIKELEAANFQFIQDWGTLNKHLTKYAEDEEMCSQFESTIEEWNQTLKAVKLTGRLRNYTVPVKIPALYGDRVVYASPVEATSSQEAVMLVNEMTPGEVLKLLLNSGFGQTLDITIDTEDVGGRRATF